MSISESYNYLYKSLVSIAEEKYVSNEDHIRYAYSGDASVYPRYMPGIVVRPGTVEQVSEIVKLANDNKTPIIPRGGGASLFGVPKGYPEKNIIVDLTRLNINNRFRCREYDHYCRMWHNHE